MLTFSVSSISPTSLMNHLTCCLALSNYMGFFAILWTTWFHISMYDVRFYVDSIFTRICKFLCFGIMVSFVGLSAMYDSILADSATRSFHGIAFVLFAARILWIIQYCVVLFYVRVFDKTLVPMLLTIFVYVCSGVGFMVVFIKEQGNAELNGKMGALHVRIWYGIICAEAIAVMTIACIWRILSFKHTHLVERVGLLTLIIMGEGIIGLIKATSYTIQGTTVSLQAETGIVGAAVLLIYLQYVLYFDNIDHHRFGTIQQQIWTLLHYPLHVAILLTVEGSTALILWNSCQTAVGWVKDSLPPLKDPKGKFNDAAAWIANIENVRKDIQIRYHYKEVSDYYTNYDSDLAKLQKPKNAWGTAPWADEVAPILKKMYGYYEYFIYQNFGAEGPTYKLKKEPDYNKKVQLYEDGFKFVYIYFYVSAGALLFVLAFLYWFGRTRKTRTEWSSIGIRILGGICLPLAIISPLTEGPDDNSFRFTFSYLLIPIVAIGFLLVIVVDEIVKAISDKHFTVVEARRLSRLPTNDSMGAGGVKGPTATVEERTEYTDEDSSYEMHRKSDFRSSQLQHGSPQVVHGDNASLLENAQRTPTIGWQDQQSHKGGYSEIAQADEDLPEYRGGQDMNRYRTQSQGQY